jgi:cytochrome P450
MEASTALTTLAKRFPRLELMTDKLSWRANVTFQGIEALPVDLGLSL